MYKIKIVHCATAAVNDFSDVANLVASLIDDAEANGQFVTFSTTGKCCPAGADEIVVTLYDGEEVRAPVSAGGDWIEFDEELQRRKG